MAAASTDRSGRAAIRAVTRSESVVAAKAPGTPASAGLAASAPGVPQVAVVAQRETGAGLRRAEGRLGVLPRGGAGRGVAGVPDGEMAAKAAEGRLVEDLADQPEVLVDDHGSTVGDGDPGGLLPTVLQRVQTEVGQLGDLLPRRPDTEDAAGVLGAGKRGVEVVRQPSITARHTSTVPVPPTVPATGEVTFTVRGGRTLSPRRGSSLLSRFPDCPLLTGASPGPRDVLDRNRLDRNREEKRMASNRPDPGDFLQQAQRMLRELFSDQPGDDQPWAEATRSAREP